jgi:hypothetical protein
VVKMLRGWAGFVILLSAGCAQPPPPPPPPPPVAAEPTPEPKTFMHHVEWRGQTLGAIARWYTGKFENWKKLTKPVNPDLRRCCSTLRVGREVVIPRELLVRTDPMPKPQPSAKPTVKPGAGASAEAKEAPPKEAEEAASAESPKEEPAEDASPPPAIVSEAPSTAPAPPASAASNGSASGKVEVKGSSWDVADGIAYPGDGNTVEVALSSKPFNRKEFAKDGKLDSFDIMRHRMDTDANAITLKIEGDGSMNCMDVLFESGGGTNCGSAQKEGLKLTTHTAEVIAGSFVLQDGADKVDVRFDLPITREAKRAGSALPPGGGEPGKALLANFAAMRSGDFERMKAVAAPDKRQEMDSAKMAEGDQKAMLEFMKAMAPTDVKILGGTVDGDSALVDYKGKRSGEPTKGTAELRRVDGKWYMISDSSK